MKKNYRGNFLKLVFIFKKIVPQTFFLRSLIIIGFILLFIQTLVVVLFYDNQWRKIKNSLISNVVINIAHIVYLANKTDTIEDLSILIDDWKGYKGIQPSLVLLKDIPTQYNKKITDIESLLKQNLQSLISNPIYIYEYDDKYKILKLLIHIKYDAYLSFYLEKELFFIKSLDILVILMIVFYFLAILIVAQFFRLQIRPLIKLAKATKKFGKGEKVSYLIPSGSIEIRQATIAFNEMKGQIENFLEQRSLMLSSVSHDLKTSLTKINLMLDLYTNFDENSDIKKEINNMIEMIKSYLIFTKSDYAENVKSKLNIKKFFLECISYYTSKINITFKNENITKHIEINEVLFKRAIDNLIVNAMQYAKNIEIIVKNIGYNSISIQISDDGIGIDEKDYANVFKPFFRINEARTSNNSSVGLGLYIVKDIVVKNGGNIFLNKSKHLGGLEINIILPI